MRYLILFLMLISCEVYSNNNDIIVNDTNLKILVYCDYANNTPANIKIYDESRLHMNTVLLTLNNYVFDYAVNNGYCEVVIEVDVNNNGKVDAGDYYYMTGLELFEDTIIEIEEWRVIK